jgi:16S rRNA processing protein RimM
MAANQSVPVDPPTTSEADSLEALAGYVRVGKVIGTHGNNGRVRVAPETDHPERFATGSTLVVSGTPYSIGYVTHAAGGDVLIVDFSGLKTREQAHTLIDQVILGAIDDAPPLAEDMYYHYQLIDMTVVDVTDTVLGKLTEVISTGANDVYVITAEGSELLIPALADVVVEVDVPNARMTVNVPEGIEPRSTIPKPKNRPVRRRSAQPKRPRNSAATTPQAKPTD